MDRRPLGGSGLEVSRIGLGVMPMSWGYFGDSPDDPMEVIRRAVELGVSHFDTAAVYGPFTNEELLGRALAAGGFRDEVVVATKCGLRVGPNGGYPLVRDARPETIVREAEDSLRRLGIAAIDLYYLHRVDEEVPFEEQWGALASLAQAGKVRAIGLSEVGVERLEVARAIHPVAALQSELSLWTRDPLREVVPWCAANDVAFVPYSPLGRGYLAGSVTTAEYEELDFRRSNPRFTQEALDANRTIVEVVRTVAARLGATAAQVALAWVLTQGEHVLPIPGTKRLRYLQENVAASDLALSAADLAELDEMPASVAPRY